MSWLKWQVPGYVSPYVSTWLGPDAPTIPYSFKARDRKQRRCFDRTPTPSSSMRKMLQIAAWIVVTSFRSLLFTQRLLAEYHPGHSRKIEYANTFPKTEPAHTFFIPFFPKTISHNYFSKLGTCNHNSCPISMFNFLVDCGCSAKSSFCDKNGGQTYQQHLQGA